MPRNGSGTYSLPQAPFVPNTTISSSAVNSDLSDIGTALTQSVSADGQTPITGSLLGFAGTVTTPSYAFNGSSQSGMYPAGGGAVGFAVGGAENGQINTTGVQGKSIGVLPGVGFGSTVTQTGSIASAVTINAICGQITTVSFTFTSGTLYPITVNNNLVAATDIVVACQSGAGIAVITAVTNVSTGSFILTLDPSGNGTGTGVFNFMVLKGAIT